MYTIFVFLISFAFACFAADTASCKLMLVPGGVFAMGSEDGDRDERPVHVVRVDSFFLGETEVTIWEYLQCVEAGKCRMPLWWNKRFFPAKADDLSGKEWLSLPITAVSWEDARAYCVWKGGGFRLPTEAEWEYAARGGSTADYFWGNGSDGAEGFAVIKNGLSRVKSTKPNQFGLFDMLGNAWEWCQDRYDAHYYRVSPSDNPMGPSDSLKYPYRVVRGGSWNEYLRNLRCANRSYGEQFRRFDGVGFRICRSAQGQ